MKLDPDALFAKVLRMAGFSSVLGPGLLRRALEDEGVDPDKASSADYRRALPRLEQRMRAYVSEGIASARARRITAWLDDLDAGFVEDPDEEPSLSRSVDLMEELRHRKTGEFRRGDLADHLRQSDTFDREAIVESIERDKDDETDSGD